MKYIYTIAIIISLALLSGCTASKAPKTPEHITKGDYTHVKEYMNWYIKEQMEKNDIVGLSVALVDDQKIVWQEGFGYEDRAKNIKATPKTRYWAGSITKLFTAMGTMKLAEEGKIDIDKPFKTYLPEFSIKSRFGSTDDITPRNIMTHHSGLPGDWLDGMFAKKPIIYNEHVKLIKNEYVAYAPNTIMSYSNLGVSLLGHAVEKVAKETYSNYIDKTLLQPLEMTDSDFKMDMTAPNTSKSYMNDKETTEYPIGDIPAGALGTNVSNLSHLAMMVNANGRFKNKEVLKASTLQKMFKVQNENMALDMGVKVGLAWFIDEKTLGKENPIYGHGGAMVAHRAMLSVSPKSKLAVVVLCNSAEANPREIAKTLLKKAYEAKTGKSIPKVTVKKSINKGSAFEGTYASIIGKITVKKKSEENYVGYSTNGNFSLKKDEKNNYKAKYLLWSFIPLSDDDLDKMSFYTETINGEKLIIRNMNNSRLIAGVKVEPKPITNAWKDYLGTYKIINQLEPKFFQIKKVTVKIEDGFLILETEMMSGEKMVDILSIVNDQEAIVEGLGRNKRETIHLKGGVLHSYGLQFKKVRHEK